MGVVIIIDFCIRKLFFKSYFTVDPYQSTCAGMGCCSGNSQMGHFIEQVMDGCERRSMVTIAASRMAGDASEQLGPVFLHCRQSADGIVAHCRGGGAPSPGTAARCGVTR